MSLFKKKNQSNDENTGYEKKGDSAKVYKIKIWNNDGIPNNYETIRASLTKDDAGVQFLQWEKGDKKFKEIFPRRKNIELHNTTVKEVEEKLKKKKKLLTEIKNNPKLEETYGKYYDIEKEINDLKSEWKVLSYPNYTFVVIEHGEQTINFAREGSYLIPWGVDQDNGVILRPSDSLIDVLSASYFQKKEKYGLDKILKWTSIMLLLINVVILLGNGYMLYKNVHDYSESEINSIREQCLRDIVQVSDLVKGISTDDLQKVVNKNNNQSNQQEIKKKDDNPLQIPGE